MRPKKLLALLLCLCLVMTSFTMTWADEDTDETDAISSEETADEDDADLEDDEDADEDSGAAEEAEATPVPQDSGTILNIEDNTSTWSDDTVKYADLLKEYEENGYTSPGDDIRIDMPITEAYGEQKLQIEKKDGVDAVDFDEDLEYVEWKINVDQGGLYEMYLNYYNVIRYGMQIQRKILIDGEVPFDEVNNVYLYRYYEEDGEVKENAIHDEVWPKNVEKELWQVSGIYDYEGYYETPLLFYLSAGEHTVRIENVAEEIYLGDAYFVGQKTYPQYRTVKAGYPGSGKNVVPDTDPIYLEAEDTTWRNDQTIRRDSTTDPAASPTSPVNRLLNIMGGSRWSSGNQSITWTFNVEKAGLYNINMRTLQSFSTGMPSYRQIAIDGEIPFKELVMYQFDYHENWHAATLGDEENGAYDFYFTEGPHTITMTVKSGSLRDVINDSNSIISKISDTYLKITKVTGTSPDTNYEYNLYRSMPELVGIFREIGDSLISCAEILKESTNFTTDMESSYRQIASTMYSFSDDPDLVISNLSELEDAQTNLGQYMMDMGEMPLSFDYFEISPSGSDFSVKTSKFGQKLWYAVRNFLSSFTKQYDAVGSIYGDEGYDSVIEVWLARGTEWGEVLKELIDESFTSETNIGVNVNILPSGQLDAGNVSALMLSITSGVAPDIALGISGAEPCEFAFRDAVVDLTQFDDFDEYYAENFYDTCKVSATYNHDGHDGVYALPETMDFKCIMYRKDIFQTLGLEVPKTWDDLFQTTLPVLYENQMSFSFPVDTTAASNTPSSLVGMTMFLIQKGGHYYTEDGMYSGLDTPEAYEAFKQWTELYTSHGLDAESSFFTRFRAGSLPIGTATYATYMQVLTQAPDLYGRWALAPMIGTATGEVDENGEPVIDNRVGGMVTTTCTIMEQSKEQEAAWEFLKWYMSEETQIKFGREIEATMGVAARWATANKNAFNALPWDETDIGIIKDMMAKAEEQEVILGGYFTTRHLVYAWNRVFMQNQNPRDSLEEAVKDINKEIRTKHEEYGFVYPED